MWDPNASRVFSAKTHHQQVDFNIVEGLECHGVCQATISTISRGLVLYEDGELSVVRGAGKFLPNPTRSNYVYKTVEQRDKVCVPKMVEREPYTGPVVQIPQDNVPEIPLSPVQYSKKDRDEKVSLAGHRDLHSSGFSFEQIKIHVP